MNDTYRSLHGGAFYARRLVSTRDTWTLFEDGHEIGFGMAYSAERAQHIVDALNTYDTVTVRVAMPLDDAAGDQPCLLASS